MNNAPYDAAYLHDLAEKCRQLASGLPAGDGAELLRMAAEYEARAKRIEREQSAGTDRSQ